jgi:hypothetical protein
VRATPRAMFVNATGIASDCDVMLT